MGGPYDGLVLFLAPDRRGDLTRLALVETQRRGVPGAGTVVAVTDGALWLQEFIAYHRPDAVRVLDWCHAVGYLGQVATTCFGATEAASQWLAVQTKELLEGDPEVVLGKLQGWCDELTPQAATLATAAATLTVVTTTYQYLQSRCAALQYATFRALGYPIGSGGESANKLVVEARLKGAGMHWARAHVDGMVALRTVVCSNRWAEAWPQDLSEPCATRPRPRPRSSARHGGREAGGGTRPGCRGDNRTSTGAATTPSAGPRVRPAPTHGPPAEPGEPPTTATTTATAAHRPAAAASLASWLSGPVSRGLPHCHGTMTRTPGQRY